MEDSKGENGRLTWSVCVRLGEAVERLRSLIKEERLAKKGVSSCKRQGTLARKLVYGLIKVFLAM